mgnify:CR=1 FL=1
MQASVFFISGCDLLQSDDSRTPPLGTFEAVVRGTVTDADGTVARDVSVWARGYFDACADRPEDAQEGLAPNAGLLDAVVAIAAPNAYWGHWPFPERYGYAALWYAGMPVLSHLCGYFPGRALGLGEDLPRGVALQWARWSRRPEYSGDAGAHGDISLPILALSFSDDAFAPRSSVDALMAEYKRADIDRRHLTPKDIGASRIGHF